MIPDTHMECNREARNKGHDVGPTGCHDDERIAGLGELGELQNGVATPMAMGLGGSCLV